MTDTTKFPPLPEPDTQRYDEDTAEDVWSYSAELMRAYVLADRASRATAQDFTLPDHPEDEPSAAAYRSMTALEKFVYDWQPGNCADEWRTDLASAVKEAIAAAPSAPKEPTP